MKKATIRLAAVLIALAAAPQIDALGQDITFDIVRFQVEGNSLLTAERIDRLTSPFIGRHKRYGDVQKALEALDNEYRRLGYGTVNVYVPEQELATGVVRLQVTEAVIDKIAIVGNKHFDTENIRASLPLLKEGIAPNMRQLSENIQLSNENPAKQVEVTLGVSDDENKVNAKIQVTEENPIRTFLTLDNTGAKASGKSRIGVSWQNANVLNADQVLTLAYTTTPDAPSGVKVDIFSVGYRLPIYAIGDSVDLIYGNSSTNTPSISPNLGGGLAINGKGQVFGLRYNHIFARQGEYSSRLVAGFDYKYMNTRCIDPTTGASFSIDPPIPGNAACTPYTLRPVSATYSGQWLQPGQIIDFNIGLSHHLFPMGVGYSFGPYANGDSGFDRYSAANSRRIKSEFTVLRAGGSYSKMLANEWLIRAALTAQYTPSALPSSEQIGLVGSTTVRGFNERALSTDKGYVGNLEAYSPEIAPALGLSGNLKVLIFYDWSNGYNLGTHPSYMQANASSIGVGLRYNLKKDISARFDLARVFDSNSPTTSIQGDLRGHFSFAYGF